MMDETLIVHDKIHPKPQSNLAEITFRLLFCQEMNEVIIAKKNEVEDSEVEDNEVKDSELEDCEVADDEAEVS